MSRIQPSSSIAVTGAPEGSHTAAAMLASDRCTSSASTMVSGVRWSVISTSRLPSWVATTPSGPLVTTPRPSGVNATGLNNRGATAMLAHSASPSSLTSQMTAVDTSRSPVSSRRPSALQSTSRAGQRREPAEIGERRALPQVQRLGQYGDRRGGVRRPQAASACDQRLESHPVDLVGLDAQRVSLAAALDAVRGDHGDQPGTARLGAGTRRWSGRERWSGCGSWWLPFAVSPGPVRRR